MDELIQRLKFDIDRIRIANDRTGPMSAHNLRWEGCPPNPNGWRLMGDLANDVEELIQLFMRSHDDGK